MSTACWFAASVLERCADDLLQLVLLGMETRACPYDPLRSRLQTLEPSADISSCLTHSDLRQEKFSSLTLMASPTCVALPNFASVLAPFYSLLTTAPLSFPGWIRHGGR